ncbi:hypothetical protein EDC94DRAFT_338138 [Helicostylum pulchrum]|nr:hypothetical protein EDC94DRAFT_338138 [Helicostylum pulchrum]
MYAGCSTLVSRKEVKKKNAVTFLPTACLTFIFKSCSSFFFFWMIQSFLNLVLLLITIALRRTVVIS